MLVSLSEPDMPLNDHIMKALVTQNERDVSTPKLERIRLHIVPMPEGIVEISEKHDQVWAHNDWCILRHAIVMSMSTDCIMGIVSHLAVEHIVPAYTICDGDQLLNLLAETSWLPSNIMREFKMFGRLPQDVWYMRCLVKLYSETPRDRNIINVIDAYIGKIGAMELALAGCVL